MSDRNHQVHEFEPVYNKDSRILILGTFPSVKSRENNFYYGHPQNRFWKVISSLCRCEEPKTIEEKKHMLYINQIAIWDVISSCDIQGSSDSSISNVMPSDICRITKECKIEHIFANGATAKKLYDRYQFNQTNMEIMVLPSTSPANAAYSLDKLIDCWKIIKN